MIFRAKSKVSRRNSRFLIEMLGISKIYENRIPYTIASTKFRRVRETSHYLALMGNWQRLLWLDFVLFIQ